MLRKIPRLIQATHSSAWFGLVVLLPLTSLPLLVSLIRTNTIAAPSTLPALWLLLTWLIPYLARGGTLPGQSLPFLGMIFAAVFASARAFFIEIPPFKDASVFSEMFVAFVTLAIGSAFYLVSAAWPRTTNRLHRTLQFINVSGLVVLIWSLVQAFFIIFFDGEFPAFMVSLQSWFSARRLFFDRTTGFAFEPSWLAHQLNMLYIPYWFAASLQRYTAHPFRFLRLSVENLLLGGGVIVLVLSKSRVGWLAFLLILTLLLVKWTIALTRWIQTRALGRLSVKPPWKGALKFSLSAGLTTAFLCAYLASAIGLINLAGRYDQRLSRFFGRLEATDGFYQLTSRLAFAERAIYWGTGWEIFNDYPFLGVGLGNAGFFFPEKMPGFGNFLTEINDILFRRSFIPNTKSIWSRLLAETGILGFAFFVVWLYTLWQSARYVQANARPILRTVGLMGTFVLLGLLIEGFSVDSFALPYLWFSLGLLSAAASM